MMRVLLAAAVLVAATGAAAAQTDPAPSPSPSPQASPSPSPADTPPATPEAPSPDSGRISAGSEGFAIESASGDFRLQLRGYIQFDGRFYPDADRRVIAPDAFILRRVRPTFQGTIARYFAFTLTPDFGEGDAELMDAFIDVRPSSALRVRLGKFKPPVGLERLQPAVATAFVERALPNALVPNRDLGVQVSGELGSGVLAYAAGVFNGAPDGGNLDGDLGSGKDLAGRVFVSPFKPGGSVLKNLGFGIAGTKGEQVGLLPLYRSGGQVPMFAYLLGVVADGTRTRIVPQLSFYHGPFGLLGEYARTRTTVRRIEDDASAAITMQAWEATAVMSLTGDAASYNGVRPRRPFDPAQHRWGALELVARVNGFQVADVAFAGGFASELSVRKAFAWGVGLNWHLSRNLRQYLDYERTSFKGGGEGGSDRNAENALFFRTQLAF
jgi:phosphate-selective porin OprO and OprP